MDDAPKDTLTKPAPGRVPLKFWGYAALSTVLAGAIGYGVAYGQGRGAVSALQTELDSRLAAHEQAREDWERQLAEVRRRNALLAAKGTLHEALTALEASNFGIAQERLERVAAVIRREAGEDSKLGAVADKLGQFRISITADVREQKSSLTALLSELDTAVPPPK